MGVAGEGDEIRINMYNRDGAEKGYVAAFTVRKYEASRITLWELYLPLYIRAWANKQKAKVSFRTWYVWSGATERLASHNGKCRLTSVALQSLVLLEGSLSSPEVTIT